MKNILILIFVLVSSIVYGQNIKGTVLDQDSIPVPFCGIGIKDTTIGVMTDFDGNFDIEIAPGQYKMFVSCMGYNNTEIIVNSPSSDIVIIINQSSTTLNEVSVVAEMDMESEQSLIELRKKEVNISQTVSVRELSKKGMSNITDGLNKVVGVSITEQINVRGLGDRYNQISLNYLPLPSSNPEFKNIDLNLFDKDFISSLNIYKTYTSNLYSESTASQFNINTKQITGNEGKVKVGINYNSFNNNFSPLFRYNQQFKWTKYRLYYSLKYSQVNDNIEGSISEYNAQENEVLNYSLVNKSKVDNLNFSLINKFDLGKFEIDLISLSTIIKSYDSYITYGNHFDYPSRLRTDRITPFNQRSFIQQFNTKYTLNNKSFFNLRTQYSTVNSGEKDRTQFVYLVDNGHYNINTQDFLDNHIFNNYHTENQIAGNIEYQYDGDNFNLKTGYNLNNVSREFDYNQRYFNINNIGDVDPDNINPNDFTTTNVYDPSSFVVSSQMVSALYLQNSHNIKRFDIFYGARLENTNQYIRYIDQLQFYPRTINNINFDLLPNIGLKYNINEKSVFRTSLSRTITRPRFRELIPFEYTQFFAGTKMRGNPYLQNSISSNIDISFEYYPKVGELYNINVFYKNIQDPIEMVFLPTASGRLLTFENSRMANVYGIELEAKKVIDKFTFDFNTSILYSNVITSRENNIATNSERPLQGSVPFILNFDVVYQFKDNSTMGVIFNRTGYKLFTFGVQGMGDVYQKPMNNLNFVYRKEFNNLIGQIKVSNILGNDYLLVQDIDGTLQNVRTKYLSPNISLSFEYRF